MTFDDLKDGERRKSACLNREREAMQRTIQSYISAKTRPSSIVKELVERNKMKDVVCLDQMRKKVCADHCFKESLPTKDQCKAYFPHTDDYYFNCGRMARSEDVKCVRFEDNVARFQLSACHYCQTIFHSKKGGELSKSAKECCDTSKHCIKRSVFYKSCHSFCWCFILYNFMFYLLFIKKRVWNRSAQTLNSDSKISVLSCHCAQQMALNILAYRNSQGLI